MFRGTLRDLPAPTMRLYVLALFVAVPLVLGIIAPAFPGAAGAALIILVALVLADHAVAVSADALQVQRHHHPRLYLGADNLIEVSVINRSGQQVVLKVRDTPPVSFHSSALFHDGAVAARSEIALSYTTRPTARGRYRFGTVTLRWRTPLGLLWRQRTLPLEEEVDVYPNLIEVQKYDLLARKGLLHHMGLRSARLVARGTEFESMRDYQPDDDFRRINWKATARRHRPITTLHESERSQRLIVMLDLGRGMLPRVGELSRLDAAINAALLLCYVALGRGDRVGLITFSDAVHSQVPARRGRAHFYRLLDQLHAVRAQPIESDYIGAFAYLQRELHGRCLVTLFTDLADQEAAQLIGRHLRLLARHHLPLCVTLRDPALQGKADVIPGAGRELYEKLVALRLLEERILILEELSRGGVLTVDAAADQLTPATINRYFELKERAQL